MPSTPVDSNPSFLDSEAAPTTVGGASIVPGQGAATSSVDRPLCMACDKSFGRPQEFRRHVSDVHGPRRQCPFCSYPWSRPDKIKAHLMETHRDMLSAENLEGICALRGQGVVLFLDTFESARNELEQAFASFTSLHAGLENSNQVE